MREIPNPRKMSCRGRKSDQKWRAFLPQAFLGLVGHSVGWFCRRIIATCDWLVVGRTKRLRIRFCDRERLFVFVGFFFFFINQPSWSVASVLHWLNGSWLARPFFSHKWKAICNTQHALLLYQCHHFAITRGVTITNYQKTKITEKLPRTINNQQSINRSRTTKTWRSDYEWFRCFDEVNSGNTPEMKQKKVGEND